MTVPIQSRMIVQVVFTVGHVQYIHPPTLHVRITQLDTEDVKVENSMSKSFDQIIRMQLDPVWNQLVSRNLYPLQFTVGL